MLQKQKSSALKRRALDLPQPATSHLNFQIHGLPSSAKNKQLIYCNSNQQPYIGDPTGNPKHFMQGHAHTCKT